MAVTVLGISLALGSQRRRAGGGPSYEFAAGSLAGEVERLSADGDYTLTVDGNSLPVEYTQLSGNQTYSTNTDLGSATPDERMTCVKIDGNLTINEGVTVTTAARKLGLLLYVTGDVTINGILDMTARGANHSPSGSDLEPFDLLIVPGIGADGIVPSAGGAGGAGMSATTGAGNSGTAGANGGTGGGGGGARIIGGPASGGGAAGTLWSGGPGGGGARNAATAGTDGTARGGAGGDGAATGSNEVGSGAGNPAGQIVGTTGGARGQDGTGGLIMVIALGAIAIGATGTVRANGANGGAAGTASGAAGGGSGGGSVNLYRRGTHTNNGTVQANGGSGGSTNGGNGGAGSVRAVQL